MNWFDMNRSDWYALFLIKIFFALNIHWNICVWYELPLTLTFSLYGMQTRRNLNSHRSGCFMRELYAITIEKNTTSVIFLGWNRSQTGFWPVGWRMVTAAPSTVPRRECTLIRYTVSDCSSEKQWLLLPASTISSLVCLSVYQRNKWHKTNCLFSKFSKKKESMMLYDASFQSRYLWGPGWLCDNHWLLVRASRTHIYWSGQTAPHSRCSPAGWLVVQRNTQEIKFETLSGSAV